MPRKFIKRYLPNPHEVKNNPSLAVFGKLLHEPNLWHLNRRSASYAAACGLFGAFLPIPGQMLVAGILAIVLRANLPLTIVLVWLTNPITIPPMFYGCYRFGCWLLGIDPLGDNIEFTVSWIEAEFNNIWQPLLLGSLVCGTSAAALGFISVRFAWRWHVASRWNKRKKNR